MNTTARRFKAILFDLGSTLMYYDAPWPESLSEPARAMMSYLRDHGLQLDESSFQPEFERRVLEYYDERDTEFIEYTTEYILSGLLKEHGITELSPRLIRGAMKALYSVSQAHWLPEEDALPTLRALRDQGYRMGIISNASDANDVETLIDKAGIREFFEIILISAAVGRRKPHPFMFELALDHFNVQPDEVVMVGDTLGADILGANILGMPSVWITRRADTPGNRDQLDTIQPTAKITTLAELPELLANFPA